MAAKDSDDRENTSSNERDLSDYINQINDVIEGIRSHPDPKFDSVPSNTSILFNGIASESAMNFLCSTKLDQTLDKLFDMLMSGDYESVIKGSGALEDLLRKAGIGEGSFKGPVSVNMQTAIQNSVDSKKFNKTKSNIKKGYIVLWNMWKQGWKIKDRATRKKYNDSVYAFKKLLKAVSKIYKTRKYVNDRVREGVHNAINESESNPGD